ncbi:MAG: transglutaminase family protein [Sphingomonadales bacterium]|nr:transglutaminase family protein [Sphingomonadales bacterium]NCQ21616.1 transglutaminase family protein [Sphingomonadales bacterium]NCT04668.1 transglutaminase family protein [Sphingomonadales bacterium]
MRLKLNVHLDYWFEELCDVLLQIEAAAVEGQLIEHAHINVAPVIHFSRVPAQDNIGERIWLQAQGRVEVDYETTVLIDRQRVDYSHLPAVALHDVPGDVVPYLLPSRYCPSDQFADIAVERFGDLEGGAKIAAIHDWVAAHLSYVPGSSNAETTAMDTYEGAEGICRDYAHLVIALARASDIPARIASVYALGVTPPDFHAVAEVFLGGAWHMVDATGMAEVAATATIGVGRDIGDVAFLTAFGMLEMKGQSVSVTAADHG